MSNARSLLVELFVEELPPKSLKRLGEAFAQSLVAGLRTQGLTTERSAATPYATPRRLAVHVSAVPSIAPDQEVTRKLTPVSIGIGGDGKPTVALRKSLAKLGREHLADLWPNAHDGPDRLYVQADGKADAIFLRSMAKGCTLQTGLQGALDETLARLPIPKVMSYQLADGWTSVNFVRPAHGLVALHGADVVPITALGLAATRETRGHRFEAQIDPIVIQDADHYAQQLQSQGAVIASFEHRRAEIVRQLQHAASALDLTPIDDDALLDEVTALVERPNVLACRFEPEFLAVPQECLILTMKANQKYFPLLDAQSKLTNRFLVVSNIRPDDPSAIVQGNERVVRPRLADAKFFFDQDRKRSLESRLPLLDKVVYHAKLGSQGERVLRVRMIAKVIGEQLGGAALAAQADRAARLAKADLVTDMVGEFPELQGVMGGYYARHDGEHEAVAFAIEDHYKPRFAGDALPRNDVGIAVALADKLETLVGLFGAGEKPTGDKDPFALRRHALGVIRMLIERDLPLAVPQLVAAATAAFASMPAGAVDEASGFMYDRLVGYLRDLDYSAQEVDAVVSVRPPRWADLPRRLAAVRAFAALPESASLAAANKRIANILRKSDGAAPASHVDPARLIEAAERSLHDAILGAAPKADELFDEGEYTASLRELAALRTPVDAFFDKVMVNAEDPALRANRLALLARLHASMNRVADLSKLAG
ncbi:MAG: glycine--tRNA ligase subunit beta [Aquincola sp.]|nr:glycine--tRNA ligase subunit beta [Aquincola sp.]MDH5329638.1 glycine--tRNA ligase subunit beta [Aquincola sp.]